MKICSIHEWMNETNVLKKKMCIGVLKLVVVCIVNVSGDQMHSTKHGLRYVGYTVKSKMATISMQQH